jgi:PIN domain nuclease of toxin-antitoxin system
MLNLDTHILVHALSGDLRARERELLESEPWSIAAIVFWELAKLAQLHRITLQWDDPEVASAFSSIHVWPLDAAVARASTQLDFRGEPADELIAATSVVHNVPLLTHDRNILASKQVPIAR